MEVVTEKSKRNSISEGYKRTEVGMIPEDWKNVFFEDVLQGFTSGATPYRGNPEYYTGDILWITSSELNYGYIYDTKEKITEEAVRKTNLTTHPPGTFLMAITGLEAEGTRGRCAIVGSDATTNQSCMALYPIQEEILTEYLFYYYQSYGDELAFKFCQGTKQQSYTAGVVKILPINIPPTLKEQRAIAEVLSDVDALIAKLNALIEKKQQVKKGAMQQLLTGKKQLPGFDGEWEQKKLGDVFEIKAGRDLDKTSYSPQKTNEYVYPIYSNGLNKEGLYGFSSKYDYPSDSITVTARGTLGYANYRETKFSAIGRLLVLMPYEEVDGKFIAEAINTTINFAIESTGVPQLTAPQISQYSIQLPKDIKEQKSIAKILSDMDAEIQTLQAKRDKYKQIKQGMMQELLTGKTRLVETKEVESEGHNWQYDEAVILSVLVDRFGNPEYPLGRFRRTKLNYLTRRFLEKKVDRYLKKAAGPYSSDTRYKGPEGIALRKDYVKEWENEPYTGFIASDNVEEACNYFHDWYGNDVLDWIEEQFKFKDNNGLELITTVDKAIVELNKKEKGINLSNVKSVIESHPEWKEKLERDLFSDKNIEDAIEESLTLFGK